MKRKVFFFCLVFIGLIGFSILNNSSKKPLKTLPVSSKSSTKTYNLIVREKKLTSGPKVLKAIQGDTITITVVSDIEDELHIHGYDKSVKLKKYTPVHMSFTTSVSGRFPYELEESKVELGLLEVDPQ